MVRIEYLNEGGNWIKYTTVQNTSYIIQNEMKKVLKAHRTKKVRAVEAQTGALIDMAMG